MKIRAAFAISILLSTLSCSSGARRETADLSSLDATIGWLIAKINETTKIRFEMGDKQITQSTVVARADRCVLSVHDQKRSQLGGAWEESDVKATIDLREVSPTIAIKDFQGSGYEGAVVRIAAGPGRSGIRA